MVCTYRYSLLLLERLEDRSVPAMLTWINPTGGDWFDKGNWDAGRLPTRGDDVVIALEDVVVTYGGAVATTIRSLNCTQTLEITSGKLELLTASTIDNLELSAGVLVARKGLSLTGNVLWTGGTISAGATIDFRGRTTVTGPGFKTMELAQATTDRGLIITAFGIEPISKPAERAMFNNFGTWIWDEGRVRVNRNVVFINRPDAVCLFEGSAPFDVNAENQGRWEIDALGTIDMQGLENRGELILDSGRLRLVSLHQSGGAIDLEGGKLAAIQPIVLDAGLLVGGGLIEASLVNNAARLIPGGDRTIVVQGDYVQGQNAGMVMILAGPVEAGQFDQLVVKGTVNLAGALELHVGSPQLGAGDRYPIVIGSGVVGTFTSMEPIVVQGYVLVPRIGPTAVEVEAQPIRPRDPDNSGNPSQDPPRDPNVIDHDPGSGESTPDLVDLGEAGSGIERGSGLGAEEAQPSLTHTILGADVAGWLGGPVGFNLLVLSGGNYRAEMIVTGESSLTSRWGATTPTMIAPDRGSGGRATDASGTDEDLLADFPLVLPELELPSEEDVLVASDIARSQLVGGRARADLLPQGGAQGAVIATLVTGEEGQGETGPSLSPFRHLLVDPLTMQPAAGAAPADGLAQAEEPVPENEDEAPPLSPRMRMMVALLLAATLTTGVAQTRVRPQRKLCSGPGKLPSRTSRQ